MTYAMRIEDMEALVRECEMERDRLTAYAHGLAHDIPLASDGLPLRIGETVWGQDGKCFTVEGVGPEFVWGRAEEKKTHNRLRPEWLTHERPDSWAAVERDARVIDECCTDLMSVADLVARCKLLAGVE